MRRAAWFALAVVAIAPWGASAETGGLVSLADARQALQSGDDGRAAGMAAEVAEELEGEERGRALLLAGHSLAREGRWAEAEAAYGEAELLLPHLSDRIGLVRAGALDQLDRHEDAVDAYRAVRRATNIDVVAMRADLGVTRARLRAGERSGVIKALQFLRRYPSLPEASEIRFLIAESYERRGRKAAASRAYRSIWLEHPTSTVSEPARERLEELAGSGVRVRRVKATERLERARKLISKREHDRAEQEILSLLPTSKGSTKLFLLRELAYISYRRGETDRAQTLLSELLEKRGPVGNLPEWCEVRSGDPSGAVRRILRGRGPNRRTRPGKLVQVAELYLDAGMYDDARKTLNYLNPRRAPGFFNRWLPWIRYKLGQYDDAIPGLSRLKEQRWSRGRRAYWVGRAHHKAGRPCEARASYEAVVDASSHGYYGIWARKRLGQLRDEVRAGIEAGEEPPRCPAPEGDESAAAPPAKAPVPPPAGEAAAADGTSEEPEVATVEWTDPDPLRGWYLGPRASCPPTEQELQDAFDTLITSHGKVLPWLARARDLWLSGDDIGAGEELRQTRAACRGWASEQAGLPRLWGGRPRVRRPRGARAKLSSSDWDALALLARGVGETGLEMRIDRPAWSDTERWHPRAYEPRVRIAAERHGIPSELIWSIMRIESYFNRYAVSHAHAVGLMQILPRTGRRVARMSGREEYEIAELMHPEASLDLSAWYLRALLDRFHGQTPLAIASYNGGPHNVAHWIMRRADTDEPLPLDEFLEEIPFTETFRYVRRVLGSMAVYHAYEGMAPPELSETVDRDVLAGVNF